MKVKVTLEIIESTDNRKISEIIECPTGKLKMSQLIGAVTRLGTALSGGRVRVIYGP